MTTLTTHDETPIARPLKALVQLIKADLKQGNEAAESAAMPYYKLAGEKMNEARDGNGWSIKEVTAWSQRSFNLGRSQTMLYMSYADTTSGLSAATPKFESLKDFRRRVLGHDVPTSGGGLRQPDWREGVKENIERAKHEAKRLHDETLSRQQEREAEKKLALRLIDIGFKILSKELHPDKGGSRDTMARLNRVRARLKQCI